MISKRMKIFDIIIQIGFICFIILMSFGIVAPMFFKNAKSEPRPIYHKMNILNAAIDTYILHTDEIPRTLDDLITCPDGLGNSWQGPYLREFQKKDPWGNPFFYEPNTAAQYGFDLISYGRDGLPGGEGYDADIYND